MEREGSGQLGHKEAGQPDKDEPSQLVQKESDQLVQKGSSQPEKNQSGQMEQRESSQLGQKGSDRLGEKEAPQLEHEESGPLIQEGSSQSGRKGPTRLEEKEPGQTGQKEPGQARQGSRDAMIEDSYPTPESTFDTVRIRTLPIPPWKGSGDSSTPTLTDHQCQESRKRKQPASVEDSNRKKKSARPAETLPPCERTIHFDEVFQEGNAKVKQIIVQWPLDRGRWYIIRCEKHNLNFRVSPLKAGGSHLRSRRHGNHFSDFNTVVRLLGTEVLGCNEKLAEKNNRVTREEFEPVQEEPVQEEPVQGCISAESIEVASVPAFQEEEGEDTQISHEVDEATDIELELPRSSQPQKFTDSDTITHANQTERVPDPEASSSSKLKQKDTAEASQSESTGPDIIVINDSCPNSPLISPQPDFEAQRNARYVSSEEFRAMLAAATNDTSNERRPYRTGAPKENASQPKERSTGLVLKREKTAPAPRPIPYFQREREMAEEDHPMPDAEHSLATEDTSASRKEPKPEPIPGGSANRSHDTSASTEQPAPEAAEGSQIHVKSSQRSSPMFQCSVRYIGPASPPFGPGQETDEKRDWMADFPESLKTLLREKAETRTRNPRLEEFITNAEGHFRCPFCKRPLTNSGRFIRHVGTICFVAQREMKSRLEEVRP